jgi:tRNA threonylcarbamoyladenosine biosynthesis protein TsaB
MAYILAVDTTSEQGSLAIVRDGQLVEEVEVGAPDGFGHILFGEIGKMLERHSLALREIDCFAAAAGPGSFTGVRVGLTAVKGLGHALGRAVVAVSNLQAVAWFGTGDLRAAWVDARRNEIYGAVYDAELNLVQDERVASRELWWSEAPEGSVEVRQDRPLARAVAAIAWAKFLKGEAQDPAEIDANYVRRSDAEMMWKDSV